MEPSLACLHHVLRTTEVSGTQHCLHPATTWLLICSNNCLPSSFSSLPCSVRTMIQLIISWFPISCQCDIRTICADRSNGFLKSRLVALQDAWPLGCCWLCKCQPCFHRSSSPMLLSNSNIQSVVDPGTYGVDFLFDPFSISSFRRFLLYWWR